MHFFNIELNKDILLMVIIIVFNSILLFLWLPINYKLLNNVDFIQTILSSFLQTNHPIDEVIFI